MTDFISIEALSTIAGCSTIITLLTQIFKQYLPENVDTKWIALALSVCIGVIRIIFIGQFDFDGIVAGIINIFVLLGIAIGIYEVGKSARKIISGGKS